MNTDVQMCKDVIRARMAIGTWRLFLCWVGNSGKGTRHGSSCRVKVAVLALVRYQR
ncbi:MAG TPA: hypothetical protein VMH22_01825 [bacterium]|nr:hypothetical protein [bacterium]